MRLSLLTNLASLNALRHLNKSNDELGSLYEQLSSGSRITKASDDPSGLARASFLESDIRSNSSAQRNVADARSMIQTSEGAMNEINNQLMRMRELAVMAASNWPADDDRQILDAEAVSLRDEVERIAQSTKWGGHALLNGAGRLMQLQIGTSHDERDRLDYDATTNVTADALSLSDYNLGDHDAAFESIGVIDSAIMKIQMERAKAGAFQARLNGIESQLGNIQHIQQVDLSRVRDLDYAKAVTASLIAETRQRAGIAVMSQANMLNANVLRLLDPR